MNVRVLRRAAVPPVLILAAAIVMSCGAEVPDTPAEEDASAEMADLAASDPARYFAELEARLLARSELRIGFHITSDGAFTADLEGELVVGTGDDAALTARGTFGGDSVVLSLRSADGRLIGSNGAPAFDGPVPDELRESLVIGLTRMGLLHNLARLVSGSPPDHADGGVGEWVRAREHGWTNDGDGDNAYGITFGIRVDEQPTAEAVLWLDERGQPVARDQTVRFPGGEMRVHEEYEIR